MDDKKIVTTESELFMLIGCASAVAAEEKNLPIEVTADHASDIARIVIDHLTGRKKIPEEDIELYELVDKGVGAVIKLFQMMESCSHGSLKEK